MKQSHAFIIFIGLCCVISYIYTIENTYDIVTLEHHESYNIEGLVFTNIGPSKIQVTGRNILPQIIKLEPYTEHHFQTNKYTVIAESITESMIKIAVYEKET